MHSRKKLIEVALPLDAINKASAREKSIRHGHPSTLHLWWARRPLAAARAVIFAQMVDDPSALPDLFTTEKKQEKERKRLFKIIEDLVQWENTTNEKVLQQARDEIWQSWRRICAEHADHPRAKELFDRKKLPAFHDPFAGGGALPLEAQRLGLESFASDLNPVAVLINKAMIEIPPRFAGKPPVNPVSRDEKTLLAHEWRGAQGLAEDVRHYGKWMRDEAEKRIGRLYPSLKVTAELAKERSDLKPLVGQEITVVAWLWARTVKCANPGCGAEMPLVRSFALSTKKGAEVNVVPSVSGDTYRFRIKPGGRPPDGTVNRRGARCICCDVATPLEYVRTEARAGRMGVRLMTIVGEGSRGRVYLQPDEAQERIAESATPAWAPETELPEQALGFRVQAYGMTRHADLFTRRQLVTLTTFSDLVGEAHEQVLQHARAAGLTTDGKSLENGGAGAQAYADAVATYLAFLVSAVADDLSAFVTWRSGHGTGATRSTFARQALPMIWDFAEANPLASAAGDLRSSADAIARVLNALPTTPPGHARQLDAVEASFEPGCLISTDPPYYDNIGYADLSDFFYAWLRPSLRNIYPQLMGTMQVPKAQELIATPFRFGGDRDQARAFFEEGLSKTFTRMRESPSAFPLTVYYAFKQAETDDNGDDDANSGESIASTGWETMLEGLVNAGFSIHGTWPMRTERSVRSVSLGTNALASSIILVCRPRAANAATATRREFITALKAELPGALAHLQRSNIAPVDLAQAAIGPGMAIYTRYARVLDAEGRPLPVREALALINQILDEVLAEQEGDFDADSRWALAWFEQSGFSEGEYGVAETLSKAKNTSVGGMVEAGVVESKRGKVRLLPPGELREDWDPATDSRLTVWEMVHHMIRVLEAGGESAAAALATKLGTRAEVARELAYRLYTVAERKKRAQEALRYNALVQSWPEIARLVRESGTRRAEQTTMFGSPDG